MKPKLRRRLWWLQICPILAAALLAYLHPPSFPNSLVIVSVTGLFAVILSIRDGAVIGASGLVCERKSEALNFWLTIAFHGLIAVLPLLAFL